MSAKFALAESIDHIVLVYEDPNRLEKASIEPLMSNSQSLAKYEEFAKGVPEVETSYGTYKRVHEKLDTLSEYNGRRNIPIIVRIYDRVRI